LIISQAPGRRVHETKLSFNDRSGDRLRAWLALGRETFYDEARVAILGMAFCYPGWNAKGGDLPPRPECAPRWHASFRAFLPAIGLTLLVGSYAIDHYPAGDAQAIHDRGDHALARFPAGILRPAASELALDTLVARASVARKRGLARAARANSRGDIRIFDDHPDFCLLHQPGTHHPRRCDNIN
jgi:hypothetical protein